MCIVRLYRRQKKEIYDGRSSRGTHFLGILQFSANPLTVYHDQWLWVLHSGQTHDACAFPAIILQRKIQTKAQFNRKFSVVSENVIFLRRVSFQNEVDVTDKFLIIGRKFSLSGHSVIHRFQYYGLHSRTCLN